MKRLSIDTIFLVFFFVLSLLFTYFLLFDLQILQEWISPDSTASHTVVHDEPEQALDETLNYYSVSDATLSDLLIPDHWYIYTDQTVHEVAECEAIDQLVKQLDDHPFVIDNFNIVQNDSTITHVLDHPHHQLNFAANIPLQLLGRWIQENDAPTRNFEVDRIVIEMEGDSVYFMNSQTGRFVRGFLNNKLDLKELETLAQHYQKDWIEVEQYQLANKDVYLPKASSTMTQKRYLLDKVPESLLVQAIFPTPNYVLSRDTEGNSETSNHQRTYQSYESTLTINPETQILHLLKNSIVEPETLSQADAIVESFVPVKLYNYWKDSLKYTGTEQTTHYYRRYLDGYPIYSTQTGDDYGQITTKVFLPSAHQTEEYRFKMPTIILQAEISDERKEVKMASGPEVVDTLLNLGFTLDEIENIQLGYNWGSDMQQYQIVDLTPHWFIEINQKIYSLEELANENTLSDELATSHEGVE
ncbi:two-component system activity regulator YycH [Dolosicoccus paucivorans]